MSEIYASLIDEEKNIIAKLEKELLKHQLLLKALTSAISVSDLSVSSIDKDVSNKPISTIVPGTTAQAQPFPLKTTKIPSHINRESLFLLRLIKTEALPANIISIKCKLAGFNLTRMAVSSRLGLYKRQYGMVETPERGVYILSKKGHCYLDTNYPEELTEAPSLNI